MCTHEPTGMACRKKVHWLTTLANDPNEVESTHLSTLSVHSTRIAFRAKAIDVSCQSGTVACLAYTPVAHTVHCASCFLLSLGYIFTSYHLLTKLVIVICVLCCRVLCTVDHSLPSWVGRHFFPPNIGFVA